MVFEKKSMIHIDLDYFYAQCEEKKNPKLKGKPVMVCMFSGRTENSGSIATANYVARKEGVKSGMPIFKAKEKIPEGIFLKADFKYYKKMSNQIHSILEEYSEKIEYVGLDEATLDVTDKALCLEEARIIGHELKNKVLKEASLSASVGIASSRMVAKIAANEVKPNGIKYVEYGKEKEFLAFMPVKKIVGIGKKTQEELETMAIRTIGELQIVQPYDLIEKFGKKRGHFLHLAAQGIDSGKSRYDRERQQMSRMMTLKKDARQSVDIEKDLKYLANALYVRLKKENKFIKYVSFIAISNKLDTETRQLTLSTPTNKEEIIYSKGLQLSREYFASSPKIIRRIGLRVSGFEEPSLQKKLFDF